MEAMPTYIAATIAGPMGTVSRGIRPLDRAQRRADDRHRDENNEVRDEVQAVRDQQTWGSYHDAVVPLATRIAPETTVMK